MTATLDRLLARVGWTRETIPPSSGAARLLRRRGVPDSEDLRRVVALPRRAPDVSDDDLVEAMSHFYSRFGSKARLWPVQARALQELHDYGGLLGPIGVGRGKTLISLLAPEVVDARRAVLLIPAGLRDKTHREFALLAREWRHRPFTAVLSYEELGREKAVEALERIAPDLIVADECHRLKSPDAAVTRRVLRYLKAHQETRFCAMSGTITSRSLREYAHLAAKALPRACPTPTHFPTLRDWADCMDVDVAPGCRMGPGELKLLWSEDDTKIAKSNAITATRQAYRRRLAETPGVVMTPDRDDAEASLSVSAVELDLPEDVDAAFELLRDRWETPDGQTFSQATDLWRHARELACGFFYRWMPSAPRGWLEARRAWHAFVRETLAHNRRGLDSELPVANACSRGELDRTCYDAWTAVRDSFRPQTVPVWLSDSIVEFVAEWVDAARPSIVWVEHVAVGERLARDLGLRFHAGRGIDATSGAAIEESAGRTVVASIEACKTGRNLQAWSRALVVSAPPDGGTWEQMLGRLHRSGQKADEVAFDCLLSCREQWAALDGARADARYVLETTGQSQKILIADVTWPEPEDVSSRSGPRWVKASHK